MQLCVFKGVFHMLLTNLVDNFHVFAITTPHDTSVWEYDG